LRIKLKLVWQREHAERQRNLVRLDIAPLSIQLPAAGQAENFPIRLTRSVFSGGAALKASRPVFVCLPSMRAVAVRHQSCGTPTD